MTLIEVGGQPFVSVYVVRLARKGLVVGEIWGEVIPTEGNLGNLWVWGM